MAIKVSGTNVIDDERNFNVGIVTATSLDVNPIPITFSPTDGSSDNAIDTNIVITYNASIAKGSGNITLRDGDPSTGDVIETIAVSSGSVSLSAAQVTINPSSDLPTGKDIYVVIDEGAFVQSNTELGGSSPLLNTYNFTTGPITVSSFSPTDGATDVAVDSNIVITFSENITKETDASTKYITLRAGSASGTVRQSIDVSTSAVSVSGNQATINPPSDLQFEEDTYVVVDENSFFNSDGDAASGNAIINTYNFTTAADWPTLGAQGEGGYLMCMASSNLWIVAPSSTEVARDWYNRSDAVTTANSNAACGDWFVPSVTQLQNPGYVCRTYWDSVCPTRRYWSNTECRPDAAWSVNVGDDGAASYFLKTHSTCKVRAFRCVSY
jgi:hypothetical protein